MLVTEIVNASFPELADARIEIKIFRGKASCFRTSFSFARFLSGRKLRYKIFVNAQVFKRAARAAALRAIIAHELSHLLYYRRHNRFELFGLASLAKRSFTVKFERKADLEAIARGYGAGLILYRDWLYRNIPESKIERKKRVYFAPEEIELIARALKQKPALLERWRKDVPRDAAAIKATIEKIEP